ncbi:MAG: hypothetical protein HC875_19690 [Anaerolineales bacterium]|nr:hypothetical protein [Anaerolineales bacterium]
MVRYTFGDYAAALDHLNKAKETAASQPAGLFNPIWQIYQVLALLALAQEEEAEEEQRNSGAAEQAEELLSKVEALNEFSATFKPYTAFARAELAIPAATRSGTRPILPPLTRPPPRSIPCCWR